MQGMLNLSKDELKDMLQTGKCGGEEPGLEEGDDLHGPGVILLMERPLKRSVLMAVEASLMRRGYG